MCATADPVHRHSRSYLVSFVAKLGATQLELRSGSSICHRPRKVRAETPAMNRTLSDSFKLEHEKNLCHSKDSAKGSFKTISHASSSIYCIACRDWLLRPILQEGCQIGPERIACT